MEITVIKSQKINDRADSFQQYITCSRCVEYELMYKELTFSNQKEGTLDAIVHDYGLPHHSLFTFRADS